MPRERRNHNKAPKEAACSTLPETSGADRWSDDDEHRPVDSNESSKAAFDHFSPKPPKRLKRASKKEEEDAQHQEEPIGATNDDDSAAEGGRHWTLALAVPGSLLDRAISHEMKTYISGIRPPLEQP